MPEESRALEHIEDGLADLSLDDLLSLRVRFDMILGSRLMFRAKTFLEKTVGSQYGRVIVLKQGVTVSGGFAHISCYWGRSKVERDEQMAFHRLVEGVGGRVHTASPPPVAANAALDYFTETDLDVSALQRHDYVVISVPVERFLND